MVKAIARLKRCVKEAKSLESRSSEVASLEERREAYSNGSRNRLLQRDAESQETESI